MTLVPAENSVAEKEETFKSWLGEVAGQWWPKPDMMPLGAGDALHEYCHYSRNHSVNHPEAVRGAAEFERITGYAVQDFLVFQESLNKKK